MSQAIEGNGVRSPLAVEARPDFSRIPAYVEPPRAPAPAKAPTGMGPFVVVGGIALVTAICLWLNFAPSRPPVLAVAQPQPEVLSQPDPAPVARPPLAQDVPLPNALLPQRAVQVRHILPTRKTHTNPRG